jgi:HAE1 family hydrophobic/amphiphilic exporter-1
MWLTRTSILRPVTITMAVGALIVLGLSSLSKMPVDLYPDIEFPFVTVVSTYPGAGPEEIETLVTKPIEDTVSTISGVKNVTSTSQEGLSVVSIEFYLGTSLDTAANDVREKVNVAGFQLPTDMQPPVIEKFSITSMPIIAFALSSPRPSKELRRIADDVIKDRLGRLKGVGAVGISGGDIREILVSVNRDQLQAYGLSIDQVVQALTLANLNLPSGNVKEGRREYAIRAVGEFTSPQEIRDLQLATPGGKAISLSDIADIRDTVAERKELARVDGNDSVTVTVLKQSGANTVDVADAVRGELTKLTGQTFDYRGYELKGVPKPTSLLERIKYIIRPPKPIEREKGILPADITARITSDQSTFVKDALSDLFHHMLFGALLAVLVVFVFLHNLRGTAIVALAIPTSIIAAFTPIFFAHFTLNQMTMLAFSVSVGVLVDDSIVVIENIYRHLRMGEKPREAALNGRTEIGLAAITITLVDVVVFVPIAFMGGIVGQFFRQYGITVAMVTLFSLFIAFTMTPMISSRWYREQDAVPADESEESGAVGVGPDRPRGLISRLADAFFRAFDRGYGRFRSGYRRLLGWALDHRLATICIGVIALLMSIGIVVSGKGLVGFQILIGTLALLALAFGGKGARAPALIAGVVGLLVISVFRANLGFEFFPTVDQGMINVSVELPAGASLEATDGVVREIERFVLGKKSFPEVDSVRATVGSGGSGAFGGGSTGASYGSLEVILADKLKRTRSDTDVVAAIDRFAQGIPGAMIKASAGGGLGGGGESPISIELSGTDMDEILRVAHQVEARVAKVEGTVNADITWKVGKPEVRARIDRYRAADRGVTTAQVARALRTSLEGDNTAKYREGSQQYDIRVRLRDVDRSSVRDVGGLMVAYNQGPVYLSDIADVSPGVGPTKIDRKNRQRMVAVTADLKKGYPLGNVVQEIQKQIADIPTGNVSVYFGGESEIMRESFGYMLAALALAVVLIYILQAALFEGYLSPFVIMFGLPLALVGALLAIVITGNTLSIITMIGIIMLMGLVGKNSILLMDYTNTLRGRGMSVRDALLEAGPTRLRPVIMTSLSLIFGLMPVALAKAHGAEGRSPMAVAVIGGMTLSTLLALVMIPVLYTLFDSAAERFNRAMRAVIGFFLPTGKGA